MNLLGLVFSLLLILSYGFHACWEKQTANARLRGTYLGAQKTNRKLLNRYESEIYGQLRKKKISGEPKEESEKENPEKMKPKPFQNGECAKMNLWPLLQKGREEHPLLYESAANLLKTFYSASLFEQKPRFEYRMLDALLAAAKLQSQQEQYGLEKIDLGDETLQKIYYRMLKGPQTGENRRSLLDYLKIEPHGSEKATGKICLFHADPDLLALFFGVKAGSRLFDEMHQEKAPLLTKETIEQICSEARTPLLKPELFEILEIGRKNHPIGAKRTLVAEDPETHVSLRRSVYLNEKL